jgi:hypothetical protein
MVLKHYLQRTPWNNLYNFWLQFKAWMLSRKEVSGERKANPPKGYEIVFEDSFTEESLNPEEWRYGHPWGFFHTDQLWWYWSEDATFLSGESLILENKYLPKTIYKKDLPKWQQKPELPDEFTLPWASGLISSKRSFTYGWIEAEIKLPVEKMQWSAFWLSGTNSWPPEIDIFEAYTDQDVNEIEMRPNIHWGTGNTWQEGKKDYGAPRIFVKSPEERFVQYAIHWTDNFIKFYFDGQLVQVAKNKKMLKTNGQDQYLVLNNGLKQPDGENQPTEGRMEIRNLKVYQKKS